MIALIGLAMLATSHFQLRVKSASIIEHVHEDRYDVHEDSYEVRVVVVNTSKRPVAIGPDYSMSCFSKGKGATRARLRLYRMIGEFPPREDVPALMLPAGKSTQLDALFLRDRGYRAPLPIIVEVVFQGGKWARGVDAVKGILTTTVQHVSKSPRKK